MIAIDSLTGGTGDECLTARAVVGEDGLNAPLLDRQWMGPQNGPQRRVEAAGLVRALLVRGMARPYGALVSRQAGRKCPCGAAAFPREKPLDRLADERVATIDLVDRLRGSAMG